jgi:hypothetical protein
VIFRGQRRAARGVDVSEIAGRVAAAGFNCPARFNPVQEVVCGG